MTDGVQATASRGKDLRKALYLLPNLVTTAGMLAGFGSIVSSFQGELVRAAWLIVAASLFDLFDGRLARLTGTSTAFGTQYDSLSDLCAFGIAPAVLLYSWVLKDLGAAGWLAAFLFFACAALRLARFNLKQADPSPRARKYFTGLSSAIAADTVAAAVVLHRWLVAPSGDLPASTARLEDHSAAVPILALGLAVLMISTIPYRSFKELDLRSSRRSVVRLVGAAILIASWPPVTLFTFMLLYVASGPAGLVWRRLHPAAR